MKDWTNLSKTLEKDAYLSKELKEEIRKMLAQKNGCLYCKAKGMHNHHLTDEISLLCIGFAEVYLKLGTNIPNYILELLKETLSDCEISELFAFISFTTCQQYFGALMQLKPE